MMKTSTSSRSLLSAWAPLLVPVGALALAAVVAAAGPRHTWDFEDDAPGKIATGFRNEVGEWEVALDGTNHVLFQKAKNDDPVFNVALLADSQWKDVDLSVKLRAVAGDLDRGGGVVWRAKDKKNYYVCRYNPLENNFRVYKVVDGKRTMFKSADTPGDTRWHTLRVTMTGKQIACYLDGRRHLEVEDATFSEPGMIGLWSKADAQSYFDDLTVGE
jgi:hypothetical protein